MIQVTLTLKYGFSEEDLFAALEGYIPVSRAEIAEKKYLAREMKLSQDGIFEKVTLGVSLTPEREAGLLKMRKKVFPTADFSLEIPNSKLTFRPVVVGLGPAGLFAALILSEAGAKPIVLERGADVDTRAAAVHSFIKTRTLNPENNVQFGEGGAGAFSDGKLKCGAKDAVKYKVLSTFIDAGAEKEILWQALPHLGTDKLPAIVKSIREKIVALGGEVFFGRKVTKIDKIPGGVRASVETPTGVETYETGAIVVATGHSARDTFEMLLSAGLSLEPRPFGIGMRIEHDREEINRAFYGKHYDETLPAASYHLVNHLPSGRSVYSFCMCPGGTVVAATSDACHVVTNGMSPHDRNERNSNAALLVSVTPADFETSDPLAGIRFQERIEKAAFTMGGGDYTAPALTLGELLSDTARPTAKSDLSPSYPLGVKGVRPDAYLPKFIPDSIAETMADFEAHLPGFRTAHAVLTGPETRSTSPVRVLRDENFEAIGFPGVFPVGEGAGYGGGIVSSAADGIRAALAVLKRK